MELLNRKMGESRWKTAGVARYVHEIVEYAGAPAAAGLVVLSACAPVCVGSGEKRLKIVDEGFLWLQLAPADGFFWLTAMYDETARLVQFYFDVTLGNHIRADGESWFTDAFADVVITPGEPPRLLDLDELERARQEGLLSMRQAQEVQKNARKIAREFSDCRQLSAYCRVLLSRLRVKAEAEAAERRLRNIK